MNYLEGNQPLEKKQCSACELSSYTWTYDVYIYSILFQKTIYIYYKSTSLSIYEHIIFFIMSWVPAPNRPSNRRRFAWLAFKLSPGFREIPAERAADSIPAVKVEQLHARLGKLVNSAEDILKAKARCG